MSEPTGQAAELGEDFNPFEEIKNPEQAHEFYAEVRKCPVSHSTAGGSLYWVAGHEDLRAAALDSDRFSSARKGVFFPPAADAPRAIVLEMDPPEHAAWRRLYMEAMTPNRMRAIEPQLVTIANGLIDKFAGAGRCELMEEFSGPLPVLAICSLIGVEGVAVDYIREVSSHFGEGEEARIEVITKLGGLLLNEVLARREAPRDDYLTYLANVQVEGRLLNEAEIGEVMSGFLTAGHESTTSALGSLLAHILSKPGLKERLAADENLIPGAIEEGMRLDPSFHAFYRTTTEPVEVSGVTIPEGSTVRLCFAAANRDPRVFERPDEFDPDRKPNPHVGFGFGRHVCVGAVFARLEMKIAVRELLRRLPDIHLADGAVEWRMPNPDFERPKPYHATFTPAPGR